MLLTALFLSACSKSGKETITSLSQLNEKGRIIGVSTSAPEEATVGKDFSEAEIRSYSDIISSYTDVANGKIDAYIHARMEMELAIKNGAAGVSLLDETYCENTVAVGLSRVSPISDLKNKINQFLQELRDDGTLDDMYERWVVERDETMPEIEMPENPEDTLRVATTGTTMPYTYFIGDKLAGYDIELAMRFASWLGMDLEFKIYDWGGIFAAAQGGDVDCIMSNLYYTKEHEESIDFSDALFQVEVTAMVKDDSAGVTAHGVYDSIDELDGKRIGVQTGTTAPDVVLDRLPNASLSYFSTFPDMAAALEANKIDAYAGDGLVLKYVKFIAAGAERTMWEGSEDLTDGHQPYIGTDGGAEFKDLDVTAGNVVRFYIEPVGDDWWFEVFEGHWGPWYGKWTGENSDLTPGTTGPVALTLTQAMIDAALTQGWWGGIFVVQGKVKLTKVTVAPL